MTDEQTKNAVEKKFELYDSAEACAEAAAPIFAANKWKWAMCGVPDKAEILETLEYLEREATDDYCETGRLIFYKGQYGHQKPPVKNQPPIETLERAFDI